MLQKKFESKVYPGIAQSIHIEHLNEDERKILKRFSGEWYVTNGGGVVSLSVNANYKYFLIKPTDNYREMFNIEREIVVIFSDYVNFEPRSLDAIDHAQGKYNQLRIEKICAILISKDILLEQKVSELLKSDKEYQVIVPFTFDELLKPNPDAFFFRNRFKNHFYTRDIFAYQSALKKDIYFFGRNDLIHRIVNRHKSGDNSGLFGLRRTGKTSVIHGITRSLENSGNIAVVIDCQDTAFHKRKWNHALFYIIFKMNENVNIAIEPEQTYTEQNASIIFDREMKKFYNHFGNKRILLIFDEIENISFNIASSEHWDKGFDFIYFWQSIRTLYQKMESTFSILIVGTNPMCLERPEVNGKDNPLFNQITYEYIPGFEVHQTREMVRTIGRIMGIHFDEIIYSKLTEDFGGHPFLIRQFCSLINKLSPNDRPYKVTKASYESAMKIFKNEHGDYFEMILFVLDKYYNDELEMLKYLAIGDLKTFLEFSKLSPYYTAHLIGYGLIQGQNDSYFFNIETVKDYIIQKNLYKKLNLDVQGMYTEICERRNKIEPKLRQIIRMQLLSSLGKIDARKVVLDIFGEPRKTNLVNHSYEDIFSPNKSTIFFDDLRKIIISKYDLFKNIFDYDKTELDKKLNGVNKYRVDAHAKNITWNEFSLLRVYFDEIEVKINNFI